MRNKLFIIIIALALVALALVLLRRNDIIVMPDGVRIMKADPRDADEWQEKFERWYS